MPPNPAPIMTTWGSAAELMTQEDRDGSRRREPLERASGAAIAAAFDLHFDGLRADRTRHPGARDDPHTAARKARHGATIHADEMRVRDGVRVTATLELEAPHVVAEVRARDEADVRQVDEVAV